MEIPNPSRQEVDEMIRLFDDMIRGIGDTVNQPISAETADGTPVTGRSANHGAYEYKVLAPVGEPYVILRTGFDAAQGLAVHNLASNGGPKGSAGVTKIDLDDLNLASAKRKLREEAGDDDSLKAIREGIITRLNKPGFSTELKVDGPLVHGFEVSRKMFPYSEDTSLAEFETHVQGLVSQLHNGKSYLTYEFNLENLTEDSGDDDVPIGFQ